MWSPEAEVAMPSTNHNVADDLNDLDELEEMGDQSMPQQNYNDTQM